MKLRVSRGSFVWIALGALVSAACAPRPHPTAKAAAPGAPAPPRLHSDGTVEKRADGVHFVDAAHGFELRVPTGWTALTDFNADDEGPPASGEMRVRLRAPGMGCAIDVATLASPAPADVARTIAAGREVFFLGKSDEPVPRELPNSGVWAATTTPALANCTDTGYWIVGADAWVRVEGRFSSDRFPECKAALDDVVVSLASTSVRAPGSAQPPAPQASRNRGSLR